MKIFFTFFDVEFDCDVIGEFEFDFDPCYFGIVRFVPFIFLSGGIDEDSFRHIKFFRNFVKHWFVKVSS